MATIKIGTYNMPEPRKLTVKLQDLDSAETGRNQSGYLFRDRVRGGASAARVLSIETMPLTNSEMSSLLTAIGGASFSVTYPDPYTGANRTGTFYVGDRSMPIHSINGSTKYWEGFSFDLIEF
jgi:hypothetical protein